MVIMWGSRVLWLCLLLSQRVLWFLLQKDFCLYYDAQVLHVDEIKLQILEEAARVRLWRRVSVFALLFRFETYGTLVTGFGRGREIRRLSWSSLSGSGGSQRTKLLLLLTWPLRACLSDVDQQKWWRSTVIIFWVCSVWVFDLHLLNSQSLIPSKSGRACMQARFILIFFLEYCVSLFSLSGN